MLIQSNNVTIVDGIIKAEDIKNNDNFEIEEVHGVLVLLGKHVQTST